MCSDSECPCCQCRNNRSQRYSHHEVSDQNLYGRRLADFLNRGNSSRRDPPRSKSFKKVIYGSLPHARLRLIERLQHEKADRLQPFRVSGMSPHHYPLGGDRKGAYFPISEVWPKPAIMRFLFSNRQGSRHALPRLIHVRRNR